MDYGLFKQFQDSTLKGNELKSAIQELEVNTWLKEYNGVGFFENFTGSGKTRIGCRIVERFFDRYEGRICIIVPSKLIREQWETRLGEYASRVEIYIINTYVNIKNKIDRRWDILIVDELHRICNDSSKNFSKAIQMSKYDRFAGLTATLDDSKKAFLAKYKIHSCFEFTLQEGYALGLVPDYNIYNIASELTPDEEFEYNRLNEIYNNTLKYFYPVAPDDTFSLIFACIAIEDKSKFAMKSGVRINGIYKYQNNIEWCKLVASHYGISIDEVKKKANIWRNAMTGRNNVLDMSENKLIQCKDIIEANLDRKTIVFTDSIDTANFLGETIDGLQSIHSKLSDKVRKKLSSDFLEDKFNQIVTVKAYDEGVDVPALEFGLNNFFSSKEITYAQRLGRILRYDESKPNKIVNFVSQVTRKFIDKDLMYQDEVQLRRAQKPFSGEVKWIDQIDEIAWGS